MRYFPDAKWLRAVVGRYGPVPFASVAGAVGLPFPRRSEIDRGRYLVDHVAMCSECPTPRDAIGELDPALSAGRGDLDRADARAIDYLKSLPPPAPMIND